MKYQYVKGRISDAVDELCIGSGDALSRLLNANEATISLTDRNSGGAPYLIQAIIMRITGT